MRIWHCDRYYDTTKHIDRVQLLNIAPQKVYRYDPQPNEIIDYDKKRIRIYQIGYDEYSLSMIDPNFIPYRQTGTPHNYENDILIDVYRKNKRCKTCEYIGVLSWRFYEKTGWSGARLIQSITGESDVYVCNPAHYEKYKHPYSRKGFGSVDAMREYIDARNILPVRLSGVSIDRPVWCNYWIARREIFTDYVQNWLIPVVACLKRSPLYSATELHRGKPTLSVTFFLEGLFSVYLTQNSITCKFLQ